MIPELVRAVADERGGATELRPLAAGMSSSAWLAVIDGHEWVIRIPTDDDLRPDPDYGAEAALNRALREAGVPAAASEPVRVGDTCCSIAPRLVGRPVDPGGWNDDFVADVAAGLAATHSLPAERHGLPGAVERFHLARLWPLDGTDLDDHPAAGLLADQLDWLSSRRGAAETAASAPAVIVHTDLHWDHLLRGDDGRLSGLLDFGDAFAGPPAWDFACLRYYHGHDAARRVAAAYPGGDEVWSASHALGLAFALYKLDKTPDRADVAARVRALVDRCRA